MFSTKVRSTILPLAVSVTFAVAALAPAVSQAAPKGGPWESTCQNAQVAYENANTLLEWSATEQEFQKNQALRNNIAKNAQMAGCGLKG